MKVRYLILFLSSLILLNGCAQLGTGTAGANAFQGGMAQAEGGEPYAVGRTSPFQHTGMPDATIADNQAEAALDVSDSGQAELTRRSAEPQSVGQLRPGLPGAPINPTQSPTGDEILLEQIRLALNTTTPGQATPPPPPLSIAILNNVQITVQHGSISLEGIVQSEAQKQQIAATVRAVPGVRNVTNRLQVVPAAP